jgi:hypothetical protein
MIDHPGNTPKAPTPKEAAPSVSEDELGEKSLRMSRSIQVYRIRGIISNRKAMKEIIQKRKDMRGIITKKMVMRGIIWKSKAMKDIMQKNRAFSIDIMLKNKAVLIDIMTKIDHFSTHSKLTLFIRETIVCHLWE